MSRKKVDLSQHLEEIPDENVSDQIHTNGETAAADIAQSEEKAARVERQRRKPTTPTEVIQLARTMGFEDRAATIIAIRNDLKEDIAAEAEVQEKALVDQQARLDKINALKSIE